MSTAQVLEELNKWKQKRFRDTEISFTRAAASLTSDEPLIRLVPGRVPSRWTVSYIIFFFLGWYRFVVAHL